MDFPLWESSSVSESATSSDRYNSIHSYKLICGSGGYSVHKLSRRYSQYPTRSDYTLDYMNPLYRYSLPDLYMIYSDSGDYLAHTHTHPSSQYPTHWDYTQYYISVYLPDTHNQHRSHRTDSHICRSYMTDRHYSHYQTHRFPLGRQSWG